MGAGPRLELTWPHKDEFLLVPKDDDGKPVWVQPDHPAAREVRLTRWLSTRGQALNPDPHLDNTVFVGDSLDAMRVMCEVPEFSERYRGKVKLIYADPPFNTGQAFEHYDDWMEHATWLSFMRDRLTQMKDLLASGGSVWVHLDDAEQHRMRCLMDEVFGADNFVGTIVWQKIYTVKNSAKYLSVDQDYIVVYAKSKRDWRRNLLPRTAEMEGRYSNHDNDPRGPWKATPIHASKPYSLGVYPITKPSGGVVPGPPPGSYWRVSEANFEALDADGRIWWGKNGDNDPSVKSFLTEVQAGKIPQTLWLHSDVGSSGTGKNEVRKLFPGVTPFSTPKPESLLERIIHIGSDPGDLVFDPFAGSGTTAAVAHKMGRRWATSELSLSTVESFVAPRLTKVVEGSDPGGITETVGWTGGGGFRVVAIEPSLYEVGPEDMVFLREGVDDDDLSRAMAGQMRFTYTPADAPFCGKRGRMLLAVIPGVVGREEIDELVARLPDGCRLTLSAGALLQGAADYLTAISRGSRALKIPRDVLVRALSRLAGPEEIDSSPALALDGIPEELLGTEEVEEELADDLLVGV